MSLDELKSAFRKTLKGKEPYPHQLKFGEIVLAHENTIRNAILSAGTGSGKTEAALVPALLTGKRVFLLYPTKALLQDQLSRVEDIAEAVLGKKPRIVVDTGDDDDATGYSADIVLTNLDKFVYRLFGYGKKRYGYAYPFRLTRDPGRKSLLIFDEAHAYDETIFSHFWFVLNKMTYENNIQTLLLSATLPEKFVEILQDREYLAFPRKKDEHSFFELVEDGERRSGKQFYAGEVSQDEAIEKAAKLFSRGRRVAIIFRKVRGTGGLQTAWKKLQSELGGEMARVEDGKVVGSVLAYHGGQLPEYRKRTLNRLQELDQARSPYLLLATHAMEVGVDISVEYMFCGAGGDGFGLEPDGFVQQIGRCARRMEREGEEDETGEVYLMLDDSGERPAFAEKLEQGSEISAKIKQDINAMNEPPNVERAERGVEYLHDEALYRYVHDHVPENKELWERGVLVTRDWEPNIELVFFEKRDGETHIGGLSQQRFWGGGEVKQSISLNMKQAVWLAPRCAWIFTGRDDENDSVIRLALGGEKERKLEEIRQRLGYPNMRDARQVPLMLLAPAEVWKDIFEDENLGLNVEPAGKVEPTNFRHPRIRRYEATLEKTTPSTKLKLQWEVPKEDEE